MGALFSLWMLSRQAGCATQPPSCEQLPAGPERDICLHERIKTLTAEEVGRVEADADAIGDTMVRGAAVTTWLVDNGAAIPKKRALALCDRLTPHEALHCTRQYKAAHLQQ